MLRLRLFSFLNYYDRKELEKLSPTEKEHRNDELLALQRYEDQHQRSYVFDDCNVNLGQMFSDRNPYFELCGRLQPIFTQNNGQHYKDISLKEIKKLFDNVLTQLNQHQTQNQ